MNKKASYIKLQFFNDYDKLNVIFEKRREKIMNQNIEETIKENINNYLLECFPTLKISLKMKTILLNNVKNEIPQKGHISEILIKKISKKEIKKMVYQIIHQNPNSILANSLFEPNQIYYYHMNGRFHITENQQTKDLFILAVLSALLENSIKKETEITAFYQQFLNEQKLMIPKTIHLYEEKNIPQIEKDFPGDKKILSNLLSYLPKDAKEILKNIHIEKIDEEEYLFWQRILSNMSRFYFLMIYLEKTETEKKEILEQVNHTEKYFSHLLSLQQEFFKTLPICEEIWEKKMKSLASTNPTVYTVIQIFLGKQLNEFFIPTENILSVVKNYLTKFQKISLKQLFPKKEITMFPIEIETLKELSPESYQMIVSYHGADGLKESEIKTEDILSYQKAIKQMDQLLSETKEKQKIKLNPSNLFFEYFPEEKQKFLQEVVQKFKINNPVSYNIIINVHGKNLDRNENILPSSYPRYRYAMNQFQNFLQKYKNGEFYTLYDKLTGSDIQIRHAIEVLKFKCQLSLQESNFIHIIYQKHGNSLRKCRMLTSEENEIYELAIKRLQEIIDNQEQVTLFEFLAKSFSQEEILNGLEVLKDHAPISYSNLQLLCGNDFKHMTHVKKEEKNKSYDALNRLKTIMIEEREKAEENNLKLTVKKEI